MIASFKTRFRSLIWFLIFSFTIYSTPHSELFYLYKVRFFPEARAAEIQPDLPAPAVQVDPPSKDLPAPKEPPAPEKQPQDDKSSGRSSTMTMSSMDSGSGQQNSLNSFVFNVDDYTGAGHLSYPIQVPPARAGLAPNLSLNYASGAGNGWIGVGWDLSVGYIQRRDAQKGIPTYTDVDVYEIQLGGALQELVYIGGGEYRLRIEGANLRIKYYSTGNYWEVWDKLGNKMRFGYDADTNPGNNKFSRIGKVRDPITNADTYRWYLDRIEDPKTNWMEFKYYRDINPVQITG